MRAAALAALALTVATGAGPASLTMAQASYAAPVLRTTTHRVALTTSRNAVEGHRYTATVRVTTPRQANRTRVY